MHKGKIVTIDFKNQTVSNTYLVHKVLEDTCLLTHPLFPECLIEKPTRLLDQVAPNIKDSTEKCLDFSTQNKKSLDHNSLGDLDALCAYFVVRRQLTPKQKQTLSCICGNIAEILFNDNIEETMRYVSANSSALDDFNRMWFNNFKGLFTGQQPITSKKQRSSIFNMAGFILAELSNPRVNK